MSDKPKLATLQRKAQRRAWRKQWDTPPEPPMSALSATMIDRDAPRRLPVWRI